MMLYVCCCYRRVLYSPRPPKMVVNLFYPLSGIICFTKQKDTEQILNAWSGNLNSVMDLIGNVNHLITKERMVNLFPFLLK